MAPRGLEKGAFADPWLKMDMRVLVALTQDVRLSPATMSLFPDIPYEGLFSQTLRRDIRSASMILVRIRFRFGGESEG